MDLDLIINLWSIYWEIDERLKRQKRREFLHFFYSYFHIVINKCKHTEEYIITILMKNITR